MQGDTGWGPAAGKDMGTGFRRSSQSSATNQEGVWEEQVQSWRGVGPGQQGWPWGWRRPHGQGPRSRAGPSARSTSGQGEEGRRECGHT